MENKECSNVWTEVEKIYGSIELLHFKKPFCVRNDEGCKKFPTELYRLPCSCTICENCYVNLSGEEGRCSLHRSNYRREKLNINRLTVQEISGRKVGCPMSKYGCNFLGRLTDLKSHVDDCCYMEVPCPLECKIGVPKIHLRQHVSTECVNLVVKCSKCGMDIAQSAKDKHEINCCSTLQNCELCSLPIISHWMEHHMEVCGHRIVPCKFSTLGCTVKDKRININCHENINNHCDIFITAFTETKQISNDIKELKELFTKTPRGVVKETVDSVLGDMKQNFQILMEKAIMGFVSSVSQTHKENIPTTSHNSSSTNESSTTYLATNNDNLTPIRDEINQKTDILFNYLREELMECCTAVKSKSLQLLEQKMAIVLKEEATFDPLVQCFSENLSEALTLMQKLCFQRSEIVLQNVMSKLKQEIEVGKDTLSIDDENLNILEESIVHSFSKHIENFKQMSNAIAGSIFDQVLQNAQKEIVNNFGRNVEKVASNFERIIKKSSEETINNLKEYLEGVSAAISGASSLAVKKM